MNHSGSSVKGIKTMDDNEIPYIECPDEYQAWAVKTMQGDYGAISNRLFDNLRDSRPNGLVDLLHAGMGICTEAGEFFDPIKKHIMYGKPLDEANMQEELGDLLWYIAIACEALNTSMSTVMTENIEKLAERYPNQIFSETDARARADKENVCEQCDMSDGKHKMDCRNNYEID